MAFTFTELGEMDGVAKWLKVAAKYRSMLGQVMNTRYERRMFVEDRLLDRVAALEGLHRAWKRTGKKKGSSPASVGLEVASIPVSPA